MDSLLEIADDPLLAMMMAEPDKMKYGEERRLFYVAMTRSRKALQLIIDKAFPSPFIDEINKDEKAQQDSCPLCHIGVKVLRRSSNGSQFCGCSSFPYGCPWPNAFRQWRIFVPAAIIMTGSFRRNHAKETRTSTGSLVSRIP
ncbi:MAG: hypothetical protein M0Q19_00580 [Candidatus Cloacimonetes bacterium]|jgi:hypothetical protein|nr:hypothetical protein [Candidatus Cloacimonadota bacterium]